MANYGTIGKGLVLGAAAVGLWAVSRRSTGRAPRLINWERVRSTALKMSVADGRSQALSRTEQAWKYRDRVRRSEELISQYLGQQLPRALDAVHVFDRLDWIDANLEAFQELFEPFERLNERTLTDSTTGARLMGNVNQLLLTSQLGMLMGYLAQRVLGQYDAALLGKEPIGGGKLYFVEQNIGLLQESLGLDAEEFRLWIALHEATHAFEFEANPWLRQHMNDLLTRYLQSVSGDIASMSEQGQGVGSLVGRFAGNVLRGGHFIEWMMNPAQRAVFHELQSLMCLVEGYSNHVMQQVGEDLLPSYHLMKERFDERGKNRSSGEQMFIRLTGLDVKYEQYALGERFVNEIVRDHGIEFMNKIWESPAMLPSMEEIRAPRRWVERVNRFAVV